MAYRARWLHRRVAHRPSATNRSPQPEPHRGMAPPSFGQDSQSPPIMRIDRHPPLEAVVPFVPGPDGGPVNGPASSMTRGSIPERPRGAMRDVHMENVHPLRLRLMLEIERTGSISAAAEACAIGQPSASMHIRTLETAMGQRLVTRTGRGSRLTSAGKIVAAHASRVLATLDGMYRAVDALDSRNGGELTLAATLTPSVVLIPRLLRQFSERYPAVSVKLRTVPSETVVGEIVRGDVEVGIAGEVPAAEGVISRQIVVDELVGIAPAGLFTANGGFVSRAEIARYNLLLGAEGSSTRILTERYLARADCQPARLWLFDSYEAIKRSVRDGLGISFVSELLVREEVQRGELIAFRVSGVEPMVRPIYVLQSSVRELAPEGAAFMKLLADVTWPAAELGQPGQPGAFGPRAQPFAETMGARHT
jgi:molybdate transport repressor ModE-like protein